MADSIGKQLKQARLKRGLSVEDISHETRIPVARLRDLEEDNYSDFPSPTYARSFLTIYSDFLDVDASEYLDALKGPNSPLIAGRNFVPPSLDLDSETTIPIFKSREVRKESNPIYTLLVLILLILIIPTVFFIGQREAYDEIEDGITDEEAARIVTEETEPSGGPTTEVATTPATPDRDEAASPSPPVLRPEEGGMAGASTDSEAGEDEGDQFSRRLVPGLPSEKLAVDPELDALIREQPRRPSAIVARPVNQAPPESSTEPPRSGSNADADPPRATPAGSSQESGGSQPPAPRAVPFRPNP